MLCFLLFLTFCNRIGKLLRNPVFSRVCKTLSHDTLIDLFSCKHALLLKTVNARIATHLDSWWAMSHLVKYFTTKNMQL